LFGGGGFEETVREEGKVLVIISRDPGGLFALKKFLVPLIFLAQLFVGAKLPVLLGEDPIRQRIDNIANPRQKNGKFPV